MNGFCPIAEQRRQVMDVPGIAGLGNEANADALVRLHEPLMHGADREQHGNRRASLVRVAVADDEDRGAAAHGGHRVASQCVERARQLLRSRGRFPHCAQRCQLRPARPAAPDRRHLFG